MKISELFETQTNELSLHDDDFTFGPKHITSFEKQGLASTVIAGDLNCKYNFLRSLAGGPPEVRGNYNVQNNKLTSLEGVAHKIGGWLGLEGNNLTSLQGIHKLFKGGYIKEGIDISENPISSHILGLLLIPELTEIGFDVEEFTGQDKKLLDAVRIINKHLHFKGDVIDCQQEMISAGLKEYAQL